MNKLLPALVLSFSQIAFLEAAQAVHAAPVPRAATPAPSIEAPRDRVFHGVMTLDVDASDTVHKIIRVRQSIGAPSETSPTLTGL